MWDEWTFDYVFLTKAHTTEISNNPPFPSWLRDEGRSLRLMMGRHFLLHLYLESSVFFQIQPGNLEQPVGTDKCSIARACTLGPSSRVFMLFIQLFIDVLRDESRAYLLPHFILGNLQGNWQSIPGRDRRSLPLLTYHSEYGPFWLPFSWSFGGSFEWEPQNCFALLTQES